MLFVVSVESSSGSVEGSSGKQMTPELLNEAFLVKTTLYKSVKRHKEPNDTSSKIMYVADSAVTDKTDTQTDYCNPAAHARRGLKFNVAAHTFTEAKSVKNERDRMIH